MKDPTDQVEMPEPTPLVAPEQKPEPDTDAEKKKAEGEGDEEWWLILSILEATNFQS